MALLDANLGGTLRAIDTGPLVEIPWKAASVALATTTNIATTSSEWRVPVVQSDVTSAFVNENEEIDLSDPTLDEVKVTPRKLASLTRISREAADDSDPASAAVVGDSISRDLAYRTDLAFVAASTAKGPVGLGSLVGQGAQSVPVTGSIVDLDPFVTAVGKLEEHGAKATAFIADSRTWTALSLLRQFDGDTTSNIPLMGIDPTAPQGKSIQGVPCYSLRAGILPVGHVWCYDRSRVFSVIRSGVQLALSNDAFFTADAIAIRATTRIAWAFADPEATCLITSGGS